MMNRKSFDPSILAPYIPVTDKQHQPGPPSLQGIHTDVMWKTNLKKTLVLWESAAWTVDAGWWILEDFIPVGLSCLNF